MTAGDDARDASFHRAQVRARIDAATDPDAYDPPAWVGFTVNPTDPEEDR